jgi:hypothetical protein
MRRFQRTALRGIFRCHHFPKDPEEEDGAGQHDRAKRDVCEHGLNHKARGQGSAARDSLSLRLRLDECGRQAAAGQKL